MAIPKFLQTILETAKAIFGPSKSKETLSARPAFDQKDWDHSRQKALPPPESASFDNSGQPPSRDKRFDGDDQDNAFSNITMDATRF